MLGLAKGFSGFFESSLEFPITQLAVLTDFYCARRMMQEKRSCAVSMCPPTTSTLVISSLSTPKMSFAPICQCGKALVYCHYGVISFLLCLFYEFLLSFCSVKFAVSCCCLFLSGSPFVSILWLLLTLGLLSLQSRIILAAYMNQVLPRVSGQVLDLRYLCCLRYVQGCVQWIYD